MTDLLLIISCIVGATNLILVAFCFMRIKKLDAEKQELKQQIMHLAKENRQNELAVDEMRSGSIGLGKAIQGLRAEFSEQVQQLINKQNDLAMQDSSTKLYSRAARMFEKGATIEEVMEECEIPRAEAELVISMRGNTGR